MRGRARSPRVSPRTLGEIRRTGRCATRAMSGRTPSLWTRPHASRARCTARAQAEGTLWRSTPIGRRARDRTHGSVARGAAFVVLDASYPGARLADLTRVSGARAIVRLESAGALPSELRGAVRLFCLSRPRVPRFVRAQLAPGARGDRDGRPGRSRVHRVHIGNVRSSKGIRGRHGSLTHFAPWRAQRSSSARGPVQRLSGLGHDPLHREIFFALQAGATVCVPDDDVASDGMLLDRGCTTPALLLHISRPDDATHRTFATSSCRRFAGHSSLVSRCSGWILRGCGARRPVWAS